MLLFYTCSRCSSSSSSSNDKRSAFYFYDVQYNVVIFCHFTSKSNKINDDETKQKMAGR
jgi:hypothetical protein